MKRLGVLEEGDDISPKLTGYIYIRSFHLVAACVPCVNLHVHSKVHRKVLIQLRGEQLNSASKLANGESYKFSKVRVVNEKIVNFH